MASIDARKGLEKLEEYEVETVDADIVVNANENNYDTLPVVRQEVLARTQDFLFNRYPPMKAETLAKLVARDLDVDPANVRVGNGSSELLQMACYAFGGAGRKIAVPYPSFSMYGVYAQLSDSEVLTYPLDTEGFIEPDSVIALCKKEQPCLLILCNPNNPTGNYSPLDVVEKIIANVECPVIVDEAYMEFAKGSGVDPMDMRPLEKLKWVAGSALALTGKYSNFMVFRTFSKAYGLAGMRVGYGVGSALLMRILGKTLLPYHVNAYSLMVAEVVYRHRQDYAPRIAEMIEQRDLMGRELTALGMRVWPTATNFLCFRPTGDLAKALGKAYDAQYGVSNLSPLTKAGKFIFKGLLGQRILIRDFTAHKALTGCMRLTVGRPEENVVVLGKIKELCRAAQAYMPIG